MLSLGWLTGCPQLNSPRIELSKANRSNPHAGLWWAVPTPGGDGPIVGIEQRLGDGRLRQWLVDNRGVRVFEFRGGQANRWSAPLSTFALDGDFAIVPSLVRARFGVADEPGWPGPRLPADEASGLKHTGDLVDLLARHWPDTRTDPPADLTPAKLRQALIDGKLTLGDLLNAGI
ncbi:MAG: hypothetical protein ACE5GE_13835 [Phycisphaerae bacterium]